MNRFNEKGHLIGCPFLLRKLSLVLVFRATLTRLQTRIGLANDVNAASSAHDLAIAAALLGFLEGRKNLHAGSLVVEKWPIVVMF